MNISIPIPEDINILFVYTIKLILSPIGIVTVYMKKLDYEYFELYKY